MTAALLTLLSIALILVWMYDPPAAVFLTLMILFIWIVLAPRRQQ